MRYSEYLCGLSLSFAGNKRWAFGVYFFTNIFIIQHHFLFVNTKNKIFNDFFIRYFCNSFTMSSTFRLSPIERCFYFYRSFKRSTGHSRTTVLLTCWLLFLCLFAVRKEMDIIFIYRIYAFLRKPSLYYISKCVPKAIG